MMPALSRGGTTVNTIAAIFRNGVFAPDGHVDLTDGARVMLHVEVAPTSAPIRPRSLQPAPDEAWEAEEQPAPCDLPMGPGITVSARGGPTVLPDPPLCGTEAE
jgi:hypothetical protein